MGEVYRARDSRLDRDVAVKVLPSHLSSAPQLRERFDREARTISRLTHPNVCTLFDIGHENGIDYLVMELLEGETLADRLAKGPLPIEQTLRYGAQIATALDQAHKQGVVHRDLKPGNVMITKGGAKVLDFGLAKYVGAAANTHAVTEFPTEHRPLTQEGTLLGTIPYMAPEQLEGAEADARTDIFALGALVYEMTTGRRAFSGKSRASLIASIMEHEPAPLASVAPMTPPTLDRVVRTCLAKDPDDRWQSAADVARELRWIAEEPIPARAGKRRWNVAAIVAGAIAALAILAAVLMWQRGDADKKPFYAEVTLPHGVDIVVATLSPTGEHVAFIGRETTGKQHLMVRSLRAEEATRVEGTERATGPFWSPDGKHVGFFVEGKLKRVAIAGGSPQALCDTTSGYGTWNEHGTILFGAASGGLLRVPARGGITKPVTHLAAGDARHSSPEFLPDGEHFLFFNRATDLNRSGIWLGSLGKGVIKRLTAADAGGTFDSGYLLYTQRRKLFAQRLDLDSFELEGEPLAVADRIEYNAGARRVAVSAAHGTLLYQNAGIPVVRQLVWRARDGRELGTLGPTGEILHFALSPDRRRAVFEQINADDRTGDLWLLDVEREVVSRLTSDAEWEWCPIWSLDGRRILFAWTGPDQSDIFEVPLAGGDWRRIVERPGQQAPGALTPDGRYLLYHSSENQRDVLVHDFQNGKTTPFATSRFIEHSAALSPDGKWVAYCGTDTGRGEIYVQPFPPTGDKIQITSAGGLRPVWRPDGKELYYVDHAGMLYAVPVTLGATVAPGKPVALFMTDFSLPNDRTYYTPLPDGRFLLLKDVSKRVGGPVRLVRNWAATLAD